MEGYITVLGVSAGEYSEKHSRFLSFIIPCKSDVDAINAVNEKRKEYWDARHVVYAYVLSDGSSRFSDDSEPHGTAGKPVLDILLSSGIKDAIIIVVRYFGGILLGTGGLVRAYSTAALSATQNCTKVKIVNADKFSVLVGYGEYDKLCFLLKEYDADILNADFSDTVKVGFSVASDLSDAVLNRIKDVFSSSVLPNFEGKTEISKKI